MQTYWVPIRSNDRELFEKYKDKLKGRIPVYLQVTNGLVGGFYVTDWFKENIHVGFLYIQAEDDNILQNIYLYDNTDAANIAIELMDDIFEKDLMKQIDVKYCIDTQGDEPTKAILILEIGEYGILQEDLYSAYFTGYTIRKYGYSKEEYKGVHKKPDNWFKKIIRKVSKKKCK